VTNADNGDDDNDVSVDPRKGSADILRTEQKRTGHWLGVGH